MSIIRSLAAAALAAAILFVPPLSDTMSRPAPQLENNATVSVDALVEIELFGYGIETYNLTGIWEITFSDPISDPDDHIIISSEIIAMDLRGDGIRINLKDGLPSIGSSRSIEPGIDFPAESFFDVFTVIELPEFAPGDLFTNPSPEHLEGVIDDFPPFFDAFSHLDPLPPVPIVDEMYIEVGTMRFVRLEMLPHYPPDVHIIVDRAKGSDILVPFEADPAFFKISAAMSGPYEPTEAIFSIRESGSPDPWTDFYVDTDGSAPSMSTIGETGTGDGWSGYLDRGSFPPDGGWYELQVTMTVPDLGSLSKESAPVYIDPTPAIPEFVEFDPDSAAYVKLDSLVVLLARMLKNLYEPVPARVQVFPLGVDFKRTLTPVNQLALGNSDSKLDSMSCGPASAASCLLYFAGNGYPALDNPNGNEQKPNLTGEQMARELGLAMGTTAANGTTTGGMVAGIRSYLDSHGQTGWTVESGSVDDYLGVGDMFDEFEADGEDVMMIVENTLPDGTKVSHCVTLGSKGSTTYEVAQGPVLAMCVSYRLDFMDPWGGGSTENNEYNVSSDSEGKPTLEGYKVDDRATSDAKITKYVKVSPPEGGGGSGGIAYPAPPADDPGWIVVDVGILQGGGAVDTFHWDSTGFPGGLYLLELVATLPDGQECRDLRLAGIPMYTSDTDMPGPGAATRLLGSYPNPFNPTTTIEFYVARESRVNITIYDAAGRTIRRLARDAFYTAGTHQAVWNGVSDSGTKVASGVYFYRFEADGETFTSKMVLLR